MNTIDKKIFSDLSRDKVIQLKNLLQGKVFQDLESASSRKNILVNAQIDEYFIGSMQWNSTISEFIENLVAKCKTYSVSSRKPDYHPLVYLLDYIEQEKDRYNLDDDEIYLCLDLIEIGEERIESIFSSVREKRTNDRTPSTNTPTSTNQNTTYFINSGSGDNVGGNSTVNNHYNYYGANPPSPTPVNHPNTVSDNSSRDRTQQLQFVSTFLSHSSKNKPLVEEVATQLCRRGIFAWLDKNELILGGLDNALKQAVKNQSTMTLFLSEDYVTSDWCRDEINWWLEAKQEHENLLPIYLDDPLKLVQSHDLLRSRFLHRDGNRVNQLGFRIKDDSSAVEIADLIAKTVYSRSISTPWSEVAIVIDQRGEGKRTGLPELPANLQNTNIPTLLFRPDMNTRSRSETLSGRDWLDLTQSIKTALSTALGTIRGHIRKVRIYGYAQTSLFWLLGQHFDRTTTAELYVYDKRNNIITNKNQDWHTPLIDGNSDAVELVYNPLKKPENNLSEVALGIGISSKYAKAIESAFPNLPLFWIEVGLINNSSEAMDLAKDVVASIEYLRNNYGVKTIELFWTTAAHVAILVSANITSHLNVKIEYMEWHHQSQQYIHLPMPS